MVRQKKPTTEEEPDLSETGHLRRRNMPKYLAHRHTLHADMHDIPQMDRRTPLRLRESPSVYGTRRQSISLDDMMRVPYFSSKHSAESTEIKTPKQVYRSGEIRSDIRSTNLPRNGDEESKEIRKQREEILAKVHQEK